MKSYHVTLLTAERYIRPTNPDWYVQQILQEDHLVQVALERKGLRVHRIDWSNREFDWSSTECALMRAAWDYTERYNEFLKFILNVSEQTVLINPPKTILWNIDKHYLRDLGNLGVAIPQTIYIEKNESTSLRHLHHQYGLKDSILKPAMSGGARHTYRLHDGNLDQHETIFQQLISQETMMLQPFLHSVTTFGEITLIIIGGTFTHAVLKKAASGDFRVQDDFGGTVHHYSPTKEEVSFAERTVSVCEPVPAYARVDLLKDAEGNLVVSELELIEPELWFRFHPPAADLLANEILKIL